MVWYPSVDDVVCTNEIVLDLTRDRHPSKLIRSREAIQSVINKVMREERRGVVYQAALLMKGLASLHAFDGGNHRTAYIVAKTFLWMNSKRLKIDRWELAYPFIKNVQARTIEEIQEWIRRGERLSEES